MHYKDDPYWLTARFGQCAKCGDEVTGKRAFYYPRTKKVFCEKCGESESAQFQSAAFDESVMSGQW